MPQAVPQSQPEMPFLVAAYPPSQSVSFTSRPDGALKDLTRLIGWWLSLWRIRIGWCRWNGLGRNRLIFRSGRIRNGFTFRRGRVFRRRGVKILRLLRSRRRGRRIDWGRRSLKSGAENHAL